MMNAKHLLEQLRDIVGRDHLLTDDQAMQGLLSDWRNRYHGQARCVVSPADTAAVAAVVRACAAHHAPIVPQGGNTGLCGAATPSIIGDAVLLSLARLRRVREVDAANGTITVEAGCLLQQVRDAAAQVGRLFPLSLASEGSCQIGGNLSTNAGGVQVLRYGNARELTLGLEVVLASGEVWHGLRGLRKDNTGYDLKQLFIGAEGTLGVITAAVLKLFPLPGDTATAWLAIASPTAAVQLLGKLQDRFGASLTACELVSDIALRLVRDHLPGPHPQLTDSRWHLLIELTGGGGELRQALTDFLAPELDADLVADAVLAHSQQQARRLWALRENIGPAEKSAGPSVKHDISLPISRIADFVDRADQRLIERFPDCRIVAFGHVGDGNLHYNVYPSGNPEICQTAQEIVNQMVYDLIDELGGSFSAEHGVGQLKRHELLRYKSPLEIELMRGIKSLLDPRGLMNPGKIL
ncbi:MAG: FAD-binding oxidoreductase [Candidatus Accumulibacter sp.]|nr:FAD-binding oxidoreductase [Accumulibacter sp.]